MDYSKIFSSYTGIETLHFELEYSDNTIEAYSEALTAFHAGFPTASEAARNIYRAFGHDVILTPDDQLIEVTEAPAIEHADGRKYKADGTVYDE